jgi:hypothetical protein
MRRKTALRLLTGVAGTAAASCTVWAAVKWVDRQRKKRAGFLSPVLQHLLPRYDATTVCARRIPLDPEATLALARQIDIQQSATVRRLFSAREKIMRSDPARRPSKGLIEEMTGMGWVILSSSATEIAMGAATKPWERNIHFRSLTRDEFATFREPGYVRIVWNLRTIPAGDEQCWLITETRAAGTDRSASRRFRLYWTLVSPGIRLIRLFALRLVANAAQKFLNAAERELVLPP